jgi:hypothetical protein
MKQIILPACGNREGRGRPKIVRNSIQECHR